MALRVVALPEAAVLKPELGAAYAAAAEGYPLELPALEPEPSLEPPALNGALGAAVGTAAAALSAEDPAEADACGEDEVD